MRPALLFPDLSTRVSQPELMDDPNCDRQKLDRTYRQLAFINRTLSRMHGLLDRHVLADARVKPQPVHIVDVGCGGGDLLAWLAGRARNIGLPVRLTGIDSDARAVAHATRRFAGQPNVQALRLSAHELDRLDTPPDYVFCNHVLHHLEDAEAVALLAGFQRHTRRRFLVSDLLRSRFAYAAYTLLAGVAFHRSFTFHDGRLSIRRGFLPQELAKLAAAAGLRGAFHIGTMAPGRVFLIGDGAG